MAQSLGPYTLGESLGTLPFGEMVEASHPGRPTPLGLLLLAEDLASDLRFRGLLRRAAATLEAVRRPGVARLIEVGEHGSTVYVAYERPTGRSLAMALGADSAYTPDRLVALVGSLAETLDAVHQRGLVHGLLGPACVVVDDVGDASIVGLGLLAAVDEAGLGDVLGGRADLAYVAPEQTTDRHAVRSADGYALGALAYALLIGSPPDGPADDAEPPGQAASPPSDPFAATAAVLRRQLARQPARRYPSCIVFAAALADALAVPLPVVVPAPPETAPAGPETVGGEPPSDTPAACPAQASAVLAEPMPATPAMIRAMQDERQRQVRALLVVAAVVGGLCAVPLVFVLLAGKGADILPALIPIVIVTGIVSSVRMWRRALGTWQGLLDDLRQSQCLQITGPVEARVTRYQRWPGYSRFTLADGSEIRVEEALHDALARRGKPLHGPGILDRLVGAGPSYEEVRFDALTILYTPSAGLVLEIRDERGMIIHLHEAYAGTTRDPDARRNVDEQPRSGG